MTAASVVDLHGRTAPADDDSERAVIGAMMLSAESAHEVAGACKPSHMRIPEHAAIYTAELALHHRGEAVNAITLAFELRSRGQLDEVGGRSYLQRCMAETPTSVGARWYAENVRRAAFYRAMVSTASKILDAAYEAPEDMGPVVARCEELLLRARGGNAPREVSAEAVMDELMPEVQAFLEHPRLLRGAPTGWPRMDMRIGGLVGSRLVAVGAATSIGKSLFLQNLASVQVAAGLPILVVTTEMTRAQWQLRMAYIRADFDPELARERGWVDDATRERVGEMVNRSAEWPVGWIQGSITATDLCAEIRRAKALRGIVGVFVDHLGDVEAKGREERERIEAAVRALHDTVLAEGVWCVMSSHVNREATRPRISANGDERGEWVRRSHLYGSSAIEKYSEQVITLTPTDAIGIPLTDRQVGEAGGVNHLMVDVSKNRFGRTGRVPMQVFWGDGGGRIREYAGEGR